MTKIDLTKEHLKKEQITNKWLKTNAIEKVFEKEDTLKAKAYVAATNILKHNVELLKNGEYELLTDYCSAILNSKQRSSITKRNTYQILNLGKQVNRKLFKQYRKLIKN